MFIHQATYHSRIAFLSRFGTANDSAIHCESTFVPTVITSSARLAQHYQLESFTPALFFSTPSIFIACLKKHDADCELNKQNEALNPLSAYQCVLLWLNKLRSLLKRRQWDAWLRSWQRRRVHVTSLWVFKPFRIFLSHTSGLLLNNGWRVKWRLMAIFHHNLHSNTFLHKLWRKTCISPLHIYVYLHATR